MSKKQDDFYFQNFIECAGYSCQAAHLLKEILSDFKPEDTRLRLDELHKIEHEADVKKHELSDRLTKAFITPIEREDIAALSEQIDDLTADNEDLQRILESGDIDGYMERLAREEYNYAYPDEYRFYDTSRN